MDLIYWYVFWVILTILVCIIVSFSGISKCDQWFKRICRPMYSDFILWIWLGFSVLFVIGGYYGDINSYMNSIFRLFYGFLLTSVIIWFLSMFGARNPIVSTFTAIFGLALSLSLIFLSNSSVSKVMFTVISVWMLMVVGFSYMIYDMNRGSDLVQNTLF